MKISADRVFQIIDVLMFAYLIVQGEFIRYYEREVHRIQSEREAERKLWREQKRKQATKKSEAPKEVV